MAAGLLEALIASSPNSAEVVTAIAAVVAAGGVILAWIQLRIQARERKAQRALELMRPLIDLERVVVDHPELGPYFLDIDPSGLTNPPAPGSNNDHLRARVFAHATAT